MLPIVQLDSSMLGNNVKGDHAHFSVAWPH
jgi:hypothetical protein